MKEIQKTEYKCDVCGETYGTKAAALGCEKRPVSQDKGAKEGDIVLITSGKGAGCKAKVTKRFVFSKEWGHYAWEKYWHTVGLTADLIDSWGSRQLTFDSYEVIK